MRKRSAVEEIFALLEKAAISGSRCPQNQPHGPLTSAFVTALARAGRVRVEVFVHNWRVVTILKGEHEGKQTAPPPKPQNGRRLVPYMVIGRETMMGGVVREPYETRSKRIGVSAPKDYSVTHGLRDLKERGR